MSVLSSVWFLPPSSPGLACPAFQCHLLPNIELLDLLSPFYAGGLAVPFLLTDLHMLDLLVPVSFFVRVCIYLIVFTLL